ncbi:shikimate dehydrogenase [Sphingomonas sp. ID0503]|uniref:shikimate dehydrogenase n=1 Tax=Sphingomonas sp. ID0503 TaxID=3399691 RepID=UPI003AFACC68
MSEMHAEVIGDPIAHSQSPLIHRFWLEKLGIAGDYTRTRVREEGLHSFFARRTPDNEWRGCNVTVPHKQAVIPYVDRLDPLARTIGAVNTVVRDGDSLVGHNTDCDGFLEPLRGELAKTHLFRIARLFGTGGAARAIAHGLVAQGFTLVVIGREKAQAEKFLQGFAGEHHAAALADFAAPIDFAFDDRIGILDLVINATTLGMSGHDPLRVDFSHFAPGSIVYDIVYSPLETPLLAEARRRGLKTVDGLSMLIGQAAAAFQLFFGHRAPREHDEELRALLTAA